MSRVLRWSDPRGRVVQALAGVILDSCPSYITAEVAATGLNSALRSVSHTAPAQGLKQRRCERRLAV